MLSTKGYPIIHNEDARPKSGTLATDQKLATVWLSTKSTTGIAFKPYLVEFKGGTAISFYKDGKVRSGTLAAKQSLVKSVECRGGEPEYATINAGTVVCFSQDGLVLGY